MKAWRIFIIVCIAILAAELIASIFIERWTSPQQFERFATAEQVAARKGEPGLVLHRLLAYGNQPDWELGEDRHNSLGYRGEEIRQPKPDGVFRIVCLGGTTTYSMGVEDFRDAYPYLLQVELLRLGHTEVEVVNGGVPGYRSLEVLLDLQFRVLDLDPDLLIVALGLSDIEPRLVWPPELYRGDQGGYLESPAVYRPPLWAYSSLLRLVLVGLGAAQPQSEAAEALSWAPEAASAYASEFARQWAAGEYPQGIFEDVPAMQMLAANPPVFLERNLRAIVSTARANGVDVVLMTYPSSPGLDALVTTAAPDIQTALGEHNELMRTVGTEIGVTVFDLAAALPHNHSLFTDGDDYTALGNQVRSELIARFLTESALLPGR